MEIKEIHTKNAPKAIGPYSQGIKVGQFIFTSGQIPIDPNTGEIVSEDIEYQAKQCMLNLQAVLKEAGSSLENIIKITVFIKNMNDFSKINSVYENYVKKPFPARSCVEVARLPKDVLCEMEAIAVIV